MQPHALQLPADGLIMNAANDEIKFCNNTHIEKFDVMAQVMDKKGKWAKLGAVKLKEFGEYNEIDKSPSKYSKIAVKPSVSTPMGVSAFKADNDLRIHFLFTSEVGDKAGIIDASKIPGNFKDNVRIICNADIKNQLFEVFAKKNEGDEWQRAGLAFLKKFKDTDFVESALTEPIANYRYFAIQAVNGSKFTYSGSKKGKDLYITVLP